MEALKKNWWIIALVILAVGALVYFQKKKEAKKRAMLKEYDRLVERVKGQYKGFVDYAKVEAVKDGFNLKNNIHYNLSSWYILNKERVEKAGFGWGGSIVNQMFSRGQNIDQYANAAAKWMLWNDKGYSEDYVDKYL